jgi:HPt (histidine-containing phosphotransfer) domain-containing protein
LSQKNLENPAIYTCNSTAETGQNDGTTPEIMVLLTTKPMNDRRDTVESDLPVLNRDSLSTLTGGDAEFEKELLGAYYESAPLILDEIERGVDAQDVANVVYKAHTLKGSSKSIGADSTAAAALALETVARENDVEMLPLAYERLLVEASRLFDLLDRILQEP